MLDGQTIPERWLIVKEPLDAQLWQVLLALPAKSGILLLGQVSARAQRRLRSLARQRGHKVAVENRGAAVRVHNVRELTHALLRRPHLVLISPVRATSSHPGWRPLPRMRASTLAGLCNRKAIALGGMNTRNYRRLAPLGFIGWAGISAFRI